jgi:cobalt-zinc-cadmium efflux system protein
VPGVVDVHDLHVWTLTSGYHAASAHVDVRPESDSHAVLHQLADLAERRFAIAHTTFQLELREPLLQIDGV